MVPLYKNTLERGGGMAGVLKFSEAASIAIHGLILMAGAGNAPVTSREISESFGVSENHTRKVMQRLARAGLITSVRGPGGGHTIDRDRRCITLLDAYEAIDGPLGTETCLFQKSRCPAESCLLGGMLSEVDMVVRRHLGGTTLADFANGFGRRGA